MFASATIRACLVVSGIALAPACQWSSDDTSGASSLLRVEGGQAVRGSIADPATTNTTATAKFFPRNVTIFAGVRNKAIKGIVGPEANNVALGIAGDVAYWRVPALDPDSSDPDSYTYTATLSISPDVFASPFLQANADGTSTLPLSIRAIDNQGNFGAATIQPLIMDSAQLSGTLAVSLQWDSSTDLDLHVLVPANNDAGYVEVWSKKRSANPSVPDGTLDFDSNSNCQIDGREQENVVWKGTPPAGHYVVRVAAASLCGLSSASWWAYASVPGGSKGEASGVLTEAATRSSAGAGSGVTVFEFDYP
jgi:hypothetical protein